MSTDIEKLKGRVDSALAELVGLSDKLYALGEGDSGRAAKESEDLVFEGLITEACQHKKEAEKWSLVEEQARLFGYGNVTESRPEVHKKEEWSLAEEQAKLFGYGGR